MIAKDAIGNTLHEGDLVLWAKLGMPARVVRIDPGGLVGGVHGRETKGTLVVEVPLNFTPQPIVGFSEFIRIVDPASEAIVDAVIAGGK